MENQLIKIIDDSMRDCNSNTVTEPIPSNVKQKLNERKILMKSKRLASSILKVERVFFSFFHVLYLILLKNVKTLESNKNNDFGQ